MEKRFEQSSNASAIASMLTLGVMSIWRWTCRFMSGLWSAAWSALALLGLAVILIPDLVIYRRQASKTQAPARKIRRLQIPINSGTDVFVINPDGSRFPITHQVAAAQAKVWATVTASAFGSENTSIKS